MYNRYIRGDGGTYTRISAEDAPLPPPEPQRSPQPPQRPAAPPPPRPQEAPPVQGAPPDEPPRRPPPPAPERGLLNGLLEKLHLSDLDAGDILLLILLFFLFRQEADEELLIAIGLLLILSLAVITFAKGLQIGYNDVVLAREIYIGGTALCSAISTALPC